MKKHFIVYIIIYYYSLNLIAAEMSNLPGQVNQETEENSNPEDIKAKAAQIAKLKNKKLLDAITLGDNEAVLDICKSDTPIDTSCNDYGYTPLIYATIQKQNTIIKTLLSLGASVNLADNKGNNALYYAYQSNNNTAISLLKTHGAKPKKKSGQEAIIATLIKKGELLLTGSAKK